MSVTSGNERSASDDVPKVESGEHGPFHSIWLFDVQDDSWYLQASAAVQRLSRFDGFLEASLIRSVDEPNEVQILSRWENVGSYRRALSSTNAKLHIWPFLATVHDQPSVFETLIAVQPDSTCTYKSSLGQTPDLS